MQSRTLIAIAVAGACAWPVAAAARDTTSWSEASMPHSVSESAPWMTAEETRASQTRMNPATYVSMANPQTPVSPNESGQADYAQEIRQRAQQVAAVEQTRVAVVRENERIAALERERVAALERERLEALERERLAAATPAESMTVATAPAPAAAPGVQSAPNAETAPSAPAAPGEQPAQPDTTAGLVDTRNTGSVGLAVSPEPTPGDQPAAPAGATSADANIGTTRGEGASASGTAVSSAADAPRDASSGPAASGPSENAYVTVDAGGTERTVR